MYPDYDQLMWDIAQVPADDPRADLLSRCTKAIKYLRANLREAHDEIAELEKALSE